MHIVFESNTEMNAILSSTQLFLSIYSIFFLYQSIFIAPAVYQQSHPEMNGASLFFFTSLSFLSFISGAAGAYAGIRKSCHGARISSIVCLLVILLQLVPLVISQVRGSDTPGDVRIKLDLLLLLMTEQAFVAASVFFLFILEDSTSTESALCHPLLGDESEELERSYQPHVEIIH